MTKIFPSDSWRPIGVRGLEAAALETVLSDSNRLVVAGPGAGKTELLAQRACYLLQTNKCRAPRQILAISFKIDAAANLKERVQKRCGETLARRFHSMTFAAFSKSLVDRFSRGLPVEYRPTPDYIINYDIEKRMRETLDSLPGAATGLTRNDVGCISAQQFYARAFLGRALPISMATPQLMENRIAYAAWQSLLNASGKSQLDFAMIGRLAELIVRSNPQIHNALKQTYSHVFVDEYQDTTKIQYALLSRIFINSSTKITAVGDSKQSIMKWVPDAMSDEFQKFIDDFRATTTSLVMNYRSAPKLVQIQETLIAALEPGTPSPQAADDGSNGEGECEVYLYRNQNTEAVHLASQLVDSVKNKRIAPRDICVLTRNTPAEYVDVLIRELKANGIEARVETELQDLLVEPLVKYILAVISLATQDRDRDSWQELVSLISDIQGLDHSDPRIRAVEQNIRTTCTALGNSLRLKVLDLSALKRCLWVTVEFIGNEVFGRHFPQYQQGTFMRDTFDKITQHLWNCYLISKEWTATLHSVLGRDTIPIITVHKSKGLEYHTVVFMGLEDSALFKFANQAEGEKRTFFVAFSRAKKRAVFTFCSQRTLKTKGISLQYRDTIGELYRLLKSAGVSPQEIS